jgi:2,4-dienoyl-CoA reductase-like NADH-dependent reductase (Old Yellow Enzyme family)
MANLFENTSIKGMDIPNRSVRSATWSGVGDDKGYVTDKAIEWYSELADGGVGLIITGYQYVLPNGMQLPYMVGNYTDDQLEGLTRLANAIHEKGAKVAPQLVHTGVQANPKLIHEGWEVWGPSAINDPEKKISCIEMTRDQIGQLIEAYGAACRRSKKAGFDGVQLHGAHGYGINQFLSPAYNKRGDNYGGSLANRYRFLAEALEAARAEVGHDFPVMIKLNVSDFMEGGLTPDEGVEIAKRLADDGIDAIEVSGGSAASPKNQGPARSKIKSIEDEAYFAGLAKQVKDSVKTPVMAVGGIRSMKTVEDILTDKVADYISMARPFIREPDLINRWKSGDRFPATCISCNGCFETGLKGLGISCKVERQLREGKE